MLYGYARVVNTHNLRFNTTKGQIFTIEDKKSGTIKVYFKESAHYNNNSDDCSNGEGMSYSTNVSNSTEAKKQQLVASQEKCSVDQVPNDDHAYRSENKFDYYSTGPVLESFISGGFPEGSLKKIWIDKLKIIVGMHDMINRIKKTYPWLLPDDYMNSCIWMSRLQINFYAMDV
ncbi:10901_t:CDS:2 [Gigaspora rosea]|nr:10901_t:CDS:2 [Gigaspora rosea]